MTAANEKPLPCPFCGQSPELSVGSTTTNSAVTCKCISPSKHRRTWISGDVWNRRAQTAAGVDDAEYTQGLAYDGVVILKDGQPVTIDEVLAMLNARFSTVDEAKEREEFELYCKSEHLCTERAYRDPEYYAERNTAFAWYAWMARARGGN